MQQLVFRWMTGAGPLTLMLNSNFIGGEVDVVNVIAEDSFDTNAHERVPEIEVDDRISNIKVRLKELRENILKARRDLKNADKKSKKSLQTDLETLEKQEEELKEDLRAAHDQEELSKIIVDRQSEAEKVAAARARQAEKRKQKAQEHLEKQTKALELASSMPNNQLNEFESVSKHLNQHNLLIYPIEPDGNCMFSALSHQLLIHHKKDITPNTLRAMASSHILSETDKYSAFIDTDDSVENYCQKLSDGELWGGHLELDALVSVLGCPIRVYQSDAEPLLFGHQDENSTSLNICFRKFAYSLGEHYDSLIDKT